MTIGLTHFLVVSLLVFLMGLFCVLTRRNAIGILMGVELILNSANINYLAFARYSAAMPLGHGPTPEEVAEVVLFLARAPNITGETIAVDGGQHIAWQATRGADTEE